jgi:phospholipid/cholesterol/gamma-HCH transport system substrate-binding protein
LEHHVSEHARSEVIAGGFLLAGLASIAYLSISIGGLRVLPQKTYRITAQFSNVGDLKLHAPVKIAGVTVGQVTSIHLADYYGEVQLAVDRSIPLPKDTIASIATAGLLGEAYVSLSPGAAEQDLTAGGRITRTEPALNVADLLARYAFGGSGSAATPGDAGGGNATKAPRTASPPPPPPPPPPRPSSRPAPAPTSTPPPKERGP